MSIDPYQVATTRSGDTFTFDYSDADLAETFVLGGGNWGLYSADGNVTVRDTITPGVGTDGVTSLSGSTTFSVTLWHLTAFVGAAVDWDATGGFTVQYTVDGGTTWTTASRGARVPLTSTSDFDIKVSFTGGVANDTSALTSLTVYILNTHTLPSEKGFRSLDFGSNVLLVGTCGGPVTVAAANASPPLDPLDTSPPTSPNDYTVGTIEMWVTFAGTFNSTNTLLDGPASWTFNASGTITVTGGTAYVNGVAVDNTYSFPAPGRFATSLHIVFVLTTPVNAQTFVGQNSSLANVIPGFELSYLALYHDQLTAPDVLSLYDDSSGTTPTITITDTGTIGVTEYSPTVDIYAYTWSMVTGGSQ